MDLKIKDNSQLKLAPFTQLEYIESTGTQYIDTGIKQSSNIIVDVVFARTVTESAVIWGSDDGNYNVNAFETTQTSVNDFGYCYGGLNNIGSALLLNKKYKHHLERGLQYLNDFNTNILSTDWNITFSGSTNIVLFALNRGGNIIAHSNTRIYEFKIFNSNNELILDLIPVKDDAGNVCMYDTISKDFFYNQGAGNFIAGPVVRGVLPNDILLKTTTLYHKNTPNVDGLQLLNNILSAQETAEDVVLNRIRVDIGNVSGSISELLQYASMSGFNDSYEPQAKPRLVGTWTINDWYTSAQFAQAQQAFDGLTIVGDPNYLLDFSQLAVQTIDDTQPNYNPAFAIVLQSAGYGNTLLKPPIPGQTGSWLLTKTQALTITTIQIKNISTVTDTNGIVSSDTTAVYNFESMLEFKYFGITSIPAIFLQSCGNLKGVVLPTSLTSLNEQGFAMYDSNIFVKVQSFINSINGWYFMSYAKNIHFTQNTPPSSHNSPYLEFYMSPAGSGAYIGSGSKKQCAKALEDWSNFTFTHGAKYNWYNYAAPQISYDGTDVTMTVQRTSDIYYTTDGSIPTKQSTKYTEPFAWDGQGVIKAMAIDETVIVGDIQYADDFYAQTCANPVITVDSTNNQVTISCATSGAIIHYTTDGTYPTLDSPVYSAPITSQEDVLKVRCFATATGYNDSEVVSKICVLDDSLWGTDGDNSSFAVQCMDGTKPNYNPAVCIILDNNNKLTDKLVGGGGGYLTKTGAAAITDISNWFARKTTVIDTNGIVSTDTTATYNFEEFDEFEYFTGVTNLSGTYNNEGFRSCTNLESIIIPQNITSISERCFHSCVKLKTIVIKTTSYTFSGNETFYGCTVLESIDLSGISNSSIDLANTFRSCYMLKTIIIDGSKISSCTNYSFQSVGSNATFDSSDKLELSFPNLTGNVGEAFEGSKSITAIKSLGNVTSISKICRNAQRLTFLEIPSTVTSLNLDECYCLQVVHCLPTTPPTLPGGTYYLDISGKLYVGDGSSAAHDDAILADYLADTNWATYSSRLDTWYNYLHP